MTHVETITAQEVAEVAAIARRVAACGEVLGELSVAWWDAEGAQALIETDGSRILIESGAAGAHALTTVLSESIARDDYDGPVRPGVIFRRQGNPDGHIQTGVRMDILGLARSGRAFDPDSIFTTTDVRGIRFLDASDAS